MCSYKYPTLLFFTTKFSVTQISHTLTKIFKYANNFLKIGSFSALSESWSTLTGE